MRKMQGFNETNANVTPFNTGMADKVIEKSQRAQHAGLGFDATSLRFHEEEVFEE